MWVTGSTVGAVATVASLAFIFLLVLNFDWGWFAAPLVWPVYGGVAGVCGYWWLSVIRL
ncbi:hypothetical protein GCM10027214_14530 [Stenotrophomonas tumulicola]